MLVLLCLLLSRHLACVSTLLREVAATIQPRSPGAQRKKFQPQVSGTCKVGINRRPTALMILVVG